MKSNKIITIFLFAAFLSSCDLILGPDPDLNPEEVLFSLWNDFNNVYAYLDIRMSSNMQYSNWHDVYYNKTNGYKTKVKPSTQESQLFSICANMLGELNDSHVALYSPGNSIGSYKGNANNSEEINLNNIYNYLSNKGIRKYSNFIYDTFADNPCIGYIYISMFIDADSQSKGWEKEIDNIIKSLADTQAIVLDIRDNRGGDIFILEYIASRFTSSQKEYLKTAIKNGPGNNDYSNTVIHSVYPAKNRYTKNIILLTNGNTISAAERFAIALKTQSHVTHAGKSTRGALSVRTNRPMINGWYYSISAERVTDMHGNYYEGRGVSPEHIFDYDFYDYFDKQIDKAIELAEKLFDCTCRNE